ncbi:MAG: amidohydrolase [Candidatus Promineifilaceae bacterium]|nr:amidohydrolase [Candidatus Promineifilaceae bacterium]
MPDFLADARSLFPELVRWRRDFHRHPELGFQETRTAGIIAETLSELGYEVQAGVGQTGVVGLLGDGTGPTVLLRFDMDALPVTEENDTDYVSHYPGLMHACGHDGHAAMGLGVARLLAHYQDQLAGTVKLLFQPAEEGLGGALAVMADGVLERPRPDVALAMHLWSDIPYGTVRATPGPTMASSSVFTLTVHGKGGHGAAPHRSVDPILAAAHIVAALQSIVSRNVDPLESVVVTVGQMQAGTTANVIPERAVLKGTVRSYETDLHRLAYRRILEMAQSMAAAFRCQATMETVAIVPAVRNAAAPTNVVRAAAATVVGAENVIYGQTMGAEDMGYILEEVPGCYFFIGAGNEEKGFIYPHHHPRFDIDERAMIHGVATMAQAAASYLLPAA